MGLPGCREPSDLALGLPDRDAAGGAPARFSPPPSSGTKHAPASGADSPSACSDCRQEGGVSGGILEAGRALRVLSVLWER